VAERAAPAVFDAGLPGLRLVELPVHRDARGWFFESFRAACYRDLLGPQAVFVQDNVSSSTRGVLRGLHFQAHHPQGKLVGVIQGEIYDVAVDLRRDSPTFGRWRGTVLTQPGGLASAPIDAGAAPSAQPARRLSTPAPGAPYRQLWIPPGFAHGFATLSDTAIVQYKCTDYYRPDDEACLLWSDPTLGIGWPVDEPVVSARDRHGRAWADWVAGGAS
jgi:dTDP-4-dehydrorhamnose 3,5-epimerase